MKKTLLTSSIFLSLILISCDFSNKEAITELLLDEKLSLNQLPDTSYISDIRSMSFKNNKFYLSDYNRNQVIIMNQNLEMISTVGTAGKGPGEFLGASELFVANDTLFVLNDGKQTIEAFNERGHLKTISLPSLAQMNTEKRFIKMDDNFFLSSNSTENNIYSYIPPNNVNGFGNMQQYRTSKETRIKNKRHLLRYKENIIAVSDNKPIIEVYTKNGDLISQYSFEDIEIIKKKLQFTAKQKNIENSYYVLVSDSYINNNKLYLLVNTLKADDKVESNKVIEFEINDTKFKPLRILNLGNSWFESVCATENSLLSFDAKSGFLRMFELN